MYASLEREEKSVTPRLGLFEACTANMLNMIGVGPFLSIPLVMSAIHGSKILFIWLLAATISLCDGLVWAELGSLMPASGGPYYYLRQAFGPERFGKLASFLVLWSTVLSAPLLIASGAVGFSQYLGYLWPVFGSAGLRGVAIGVCLANVILLYRKISSVAIISVGLWVVVIGTILWITLSGMHHIPAAFEEQFHIHGIFHARSLSIWQGIGAASLIAVYDYAGYYNVCLIGGELKRPERTIPYSIILSILIVAVLYVAMNLAIVGTLPLQQSMHSKAVIAEYMQAIEGNRSATIAGALVLVASFASVFAILLGYSRLPFAAAREGEFLSVFSRLHPTKNFPHISLLLLGIASAFACLLNLSTLISLVIVLQAMVQFVGQCVAVIVLRRSNRRERHATFRMPLYPLPAIVALLGWVLIILSSGSRVILLSLAAAAAGTLVFLLQSHHRQAWPFRERWDIRPSP